MGGKWCRGDIRGGVNMRHAWFKEIQKMEKRGGLGLGAISGRKVVFIKLSMVGDINLRGGGIKTTKTFVGRVVP